MYNMVKESSMSYQRLMDQKDYRGKLVKPFHLLNDIEDFAKARKSDDSTYKNLCDLICEMKKLYKTGDVKYHPFDNFLREVEDAGFDINNIKASNTTDSSVLRDQIELMRMFMSFKYLIITKPEVPYR